MEPVQLVTEIAAEQYGAISTSQLRHAGLSAKAQRAAVGRGWLELAAPKVLVIAGSPPTWHRRLQVGLLVLDGAGWVSHEAAAGLHGLDRTVAEALTFTASRSARGHVFADWMCVHTTELLGPYDIVRLGGLRCTSATRTILDLAAAGASFLRLAAAIDSSVRLRLSAPLVLATRLTDLRGSGRPGVRILDRLLLDAGGESMLERRFLQLVRTHDLPRPTSQKKIFDQRRQIARVDFLYETERLVIEVTGRLGHSSPSERTRDAQRRNELQDIGYRVYEYTWGDVTRRPSYVIESLRARLAAASSFMSEL